MRIKISFWVRQRKIHVVVTAINAFQLNNTLTIMYLQTEKHVNLCTLVKKKSENKALSAFVTKNPTAPQQQQKLGYST